MKRHRTGLGNKLKVEHHMLEGLRPKLEDLAKLDAVKAIVPGRIRKVRANGTALRLTEQAATVTGLKLAAHGSGAVQEIFVVTSDAAQVRAWLDTAEQAGLPFSCFFLC